MTTEQKKKAIQAGTHLLENDGTVEELNKTLLECFPEDCRSVGLYKYYFRNKAKKIEYDMEDHNFYNLPTIKASRFFIDEPEETMINISVKRLDELVQELTDKMELGANSTMYKNAFLYGVIKLSELLKLEAK